MWGLRGFVQLAGGLSGRIRTGVGDLSRSEYFEAMIFFSVYSFLEARN